MSNAERENRYINILWYAAQLGQSKMTRPIDEYSDNDLIYIESNLKVIHDNHVRDTIRQRSC